MPESASSPTQPSSTARATNGSHGSPAATVTTTPPQVDSAPSWSAWTPLVAISTTVPGKPSSATTRLLPPATTRTGSPASSARRTASTSASSVVARSHLRAGPPSRSVVWSRSSSGTQDRHRVAEHGLPTAGDGQRDRAVVAPAADDLDLGAALGDDDRLGELRGELGDPAGLAELLVDVAGGQSQGEHAVRDHVGEADAARDLGVLVDRVGVTARRGVGDQRRTGHRVRRGREVGHHTPARWTRVASAVQTSAPPSSVIALEVVMMSVPAIWRRPLTVSVAESRSPATTVRSWTNLCWPCTTWWSSIPTSGSVISACIAAKATTIGNVAGAGPPVRYGVPVAAAKSETACSVTSYASVGGNVRPARDASTAMVRTYPERNDARPAEPDGRGLDELDRRGRGSTGQRVSRCGVCLRQRGQNFDSSMRSGSFRRFFLVM